MRGLWSVRMWKTLAFSRKLKCLAARKAANNFQSKAEYQYCSAGDSLVLKKARC
jgi:hypothetical protein